MHNSEPRKQRLEVADVFHRYLDQYQAGHRLSAEQHKVIRHIKDCRTAAMGGHVEACDSCSHTRIAYNSCRDRHCPKCQTMVKEQWLAARKAELLPCGYFHLVFTLPHSLNPLVLHMLMITLIEPPCDRRNGATPVIVIAPIEPLRDHPNGATLRSP